VIYLALVLTFGLFARVVLSVHQENVALRKARTRTAALMRRVRRDRDSREESFQAAVEVCKEEVAKNAALMEELDFYREGERVQEVARMN
jgi:hypothetical protein